MDKWEKAIREKVHAANILTDGEWVYLVGLFGMARDHADCDAPKLRAALQETLKGYLDTEYYDQEIVDRARAALSSQQETRQTFTDKHGFEICSKCRVEVKGGRCGCDDR